MIRMDSGRTFTIVLYMIIVIAAVKGVIGVREESSEGGHCHMAVFRNFQQTDH